MTTSTYDFVFIRYISSLSNIKLGLLSFNSDQISSLEISEEMPLIITLRNTMNQQGILIENLDSSTYLLDNALFAASLSGNVMFHLNLLTRSISEKLMPIFDKGSSHFHTQEVCWEGYSCRDFSMIVMF